LAVVQFAVAIAVSGTGSSVGALDTSVAIEQETVEREIVGTFVGTSVGMVTAGTYSPYSSCSSSSSTQGNCWNGRSQLGWVPCLHLQFEVGKWAWQVVE